VQIADVTSDTGFKSDGSARIHMDTDVVVVGGGATGAGTARDLAARGLDVTLLDRDGLLGGTSGHSHGLLHSGARYAEDDAEEARECIRENRVLRDIAGAAVRDTGGLFVSLPGDDPDYYDRKVDTCRECGIPVEELAPGAARDRESELGDVDRAFAVPDAVVYPSRLVAANAAAAREYGADVRTDAPVTDVRVDDGTAIAVETPGGTVSARFVVNATGAWAGEVAGMAGLSLEMNPTRGAMVVVDLTVAPVLNRCRPPADGDIVVPHDDRAVLGTTSVPVDDPEAYPREDAEVERVVQECGAMVPGLADAEVLSTYWGVRPLYGDSSRETAREVSRGFHLVDHAEDGVDRFCSIVGGKLTTYRSMAEAVVDHVCDRLGHDASCRTAAEQLPGANDPDALDGFVREFGGSGPADADVVGQRP
jgi:glycerol-3-phosphate dehydrogenase